MDNKLLKKLAQDYTLLYVEDEEFLQEATAEIFKYLFKEVVLAKDGEEAVSLYRSNFNKTGKNFDIVITDIQMPKMNGIDLSKELLKLNKNQKIVIVSAYNEAEYFIELRKIGVSNFMQKPSSSQEITNILYEICMELDKEK
ncbi:MAG: response regulator [Campylobacterota bacterium]|nr:response regulator [Campylobacterota bacterium]